MPTTFDRTWQMSWNQIMDSTSGETALKNAVWQLKAMLKGEITLNDNTATPIGSPAGLWTCHYSCDGVTAGTAGDGVDRWTGTYTVGKLVDSNGGAHSWMVLKSPTNFGGATGFLYMVLELNQNNGTGFTCTVSRSAPTGGTTTARPTAPDEIGGIWTSFCANNTNTRFHGGMTSLGEWYALTSTGGVNFCGTGLLTALQDAKSADGFPYLFVSGGSTGSTGRPIYYGNSGVASPANCWGRDKNNAVTIHPSMAPWGPANNAAQTIFINQTTTDATDSAYDDLPVYVFVAQQGQFSLRGRLPDIRWAPTGTTEPSYEPVAGTPQSVIVSGVWFPTYIVPIF